MVESKQKRPHFKVAVAQMKFRPDVPGNADWIVSRIHAAGRNRVDAILFPECAVTGYARDFSSILPDEIEAAISAVRKAARSAACHVLVGCPTFARGKRFNSLLVFDRRGREIFRYSKIHLTAGDARFFTPGNLLAFFRLDGIPATAIICHERRYPELVRIPVMMGAQIIFHPNAGLDTWEVSKTKRHGRDGMVARAFENEVFYIFANSVGPQGGGLWSAGDSKIVAADSSLLALADNQNEVVISAELDLARAGRKYACEALNQPVFLRRYWKSILAACGKQAKRRKTL
jgi:predicted amidohydrolase